MQISNYLIQNNSNNWLIKSILYASYNSMLLIPILPSIKKYIKKEKSIIYISLAVTIITQMLLITIYLYLINIDVDITKLEMPAVYAISKIVPKIKKIYGITILISIFTTAISLGISFIKNVSKKERNNTKTSAIICITAIILSKIGFSNLVNFLYPILGALGAIQIMQIMFKNIAKKTKN